MDNQWVAGRYQIFGHRPSHDPESDESDGLCHDTPEQGQLCG
jgi:hypothetical protein